MATDLGIGVVETALVRDSLQRIAGSAIFGKPDPASAYAEIAGSVDAL